MKSRRWTDAAVAILAPFSVLSLVGFFLAGHDIYHDYASPEVWMRAGQPLPAWYADWNRTPLEWGMMQVGFVVIVAFHVVLFARYVVGARITRPE
jgi:hypothetical protein